MLFTPLAIAEKYNYLDDKFKAAYKWLAETDLANTPVGKYPICEGVTASVQEYTSKALEEGKFEAHDRFFDIQYVISGKERFGVCRREDLEVTEEHPDRDVNFYKEPALSGYVILQAGDAIIVAPEDAHEPGLQVDGPETVRKVVVKVAV